MVVDVRELVFIKENAPSNLGALIAENLKMNRSTVNNEISRIKKEYDPAIITEARRLLKVIKNVEYNPEESKSIPAA